MSFIAVKAAREAGGVRRMHTYTIAGHYDVSQHCYNMAAMLAILKPDYSRELMWEVLFHDVGERWTGDLPAVIKWGHPTLKIESEKVESLAREKFSLVEEKLSPEDHVWLKALDMLEFYLWCRDQSSLGNNTIIKPLNAAYRHLNTIELPEPVRALFEESAATVGWARLEDTV